MAPSLRPPARALQAILGAALLMAPLAPQAQAQTQESRRPMTFLDAQLMKRAASPTPSPDGQWLLYTVSTPDWQEATRQTDIHLVSLEQGVDSSRRMTFTDESNETDPAWLMDGSAFAFLSDRDEDGGDQIYLMRPDGGGARRITNAEDGVRDFAFSKDGRWIAYRSGPSGIEQLYRLPVDALDTAEPETLTERASGIGSWEWAPDSRRIYFISPDTAEPEERLRQVEGFTVDIRNRETPLESLWALQPDSRRLTRLTQDPTITVSGFTVSADGRWIGFRGTSASRYERNITEEGINTDLFLLDVASRRIERLTDNHEVPERGPSFSPDGRWVAFSAPDDMTRYSMKNRRVYLRAVTDRGGEWKKLGSSFDGDLSVDFWSEDGSTIYFNAGIRATNQLMALDVERDEVHQLTQEPASLRVSTDASTGVVLVNYSDGSTPPTLYTVASLDEIGSRQAWTQLTDVNPQVRGFALGEQEEITWRSKDGSVVGGVLVKPVGYQPDIRYPLIVAIHGGPASADVLSFNGGYGSQIYAGAGYMVFRPNYRGSTNYGEKHKTDIVGNYFPPGFDDIMSGVDYLIDQGMVDPDRMGALGWSAGGHWSNWILTHTNRFKAISSGAGTSNWISMYAESDVQRNRQFYLGDKLPYDDFDAYWDQSPLKYIKNAKTPTMIHVVLGDPRVPSPQSIELHMALKKLGVPTELFVYPGESHGIPDARNQLVKDMSQMDWMDHYVRGGGELFQWRDVLNTLDEKDRPRVSAPATQGGGSF